MQWAEFTGPRAPDIARCWAYMDDSVMAFGSVFEMKSGQYKVIYSKVGELIPTCDGPFLSLDDAKKHMEFVPSVVTLRARSVILDQAFF